MCKANLAASVKDTMPQAKPTGGKMTQIYRKYALQCCFNWL
jgi:hypothetical protein